MAANEVHLINLTYLENRMGELGLKNYWVADQIGVDRKTLTRWLSGKVKTMKSENLQALAKILNCKPEELILRDASAVIASKAEQAIAAELIVQENLLLTLTPLGQWPLLESIVKATMQPDVPLPVMGKLYNLLSICAWRQAQIDRAKGFATKALDIGTKLGHRGVIAQAHTNLAQINSYQGNLQEAIYLNTLVISERKYIEEERTIAAAMSNLAQDLQIYGDFEKSRTTQEEAIALYSSLGLPLNLSIAYCGLGLLETEVGDFAAALRALNTSLEFAEKSNYVRGLSAVRIYLADIYAAQEDILTAQKLLHEGMAGFAKLHLFEALNYEIAARLCRRQGDFEGAAKLLAEATKHAEKFPLERASLYVESSKLAMARHDNSRAAQDIEKACEIYANAGAVLRLATLKVHRP